MTATAAGAAFLLGLSGFMSASAACAVAPSPEVLIATRVPQGLAGGLMVPQVFGIIRSSFSGEQCGKAGKQAGAASAVLTTICQIGGAAGVAVLGVVFFAALDDSVTAGTRPLAAYAHAPATILPWEIACYVGAAALMCLLPRRAVRPQDAPPIA